MADEQRPAIQIRCVCGKHYRVRNAKAGYRTECPECGSLLEVTEADLETSFGADGSIAFHEEQYEAKAAVPISLDELRPATKDARPGVSEGVVYANPEALMHSAMSGRPADSFSPAGLAAVDDSAPVQRRPFVADLVASFYFAGRKRNAMNVVGTTIGTSLVFAIGGLFAPLARGAFLFQIPGSFNLFQIPMFFFYTLGTLYIVHYYWLILTTTASGEDDLQWYATDWDWWHDAFKPLVWIFFITFVCSLPALWVHWYVPSAIPFKAVLGATALGLGWLFWPVAVMSVALGNSIMFIRPDWLVRCVIGIGPVYLIAWLLVMATLVPWFTYMLLPNPASQISTIWIGILVRMAYQMFSVAVSLYFGYVLFRMLGLLFRHFRARFPWKY